MGRTYDIGLKEALSLTFNAIGTLKPVPVPVHEGCGLVASEDLAGVVDCPSATSSLRDGYAVISADIEKASRGNGIPLMVSGTLAAGDPTCKTVRPGETIQVLTGAVIPKGADAVVSVEFTELQGDRVVCYRDAPPGCNLLFQGSDVATDDLIVNRGQLLTPALTGFLAAGGLDRVTVFPSPRVAVVATGDEVIAPGHPLKPGQLYASNIVTLYSWLRHFGMPGETAVVRDDPHELEKTFQDLLKKNDALLTSGGAWKSERDLTTKILDEMGWEMLFHRVRIGPGKAVALGILDGKPIFCLPGGPPSNEMAFLQIALPGLLQMAGKPTAPFSFKKVRLAEDVSGDITWTQFFQATLEKKGGEWWGIPHRMKSRIQSQARAQALIRIPEGVECVTSGNIIEVQTFI
ncbi:MAG: molybdopterin molybdotransferase MoeA [Deltaproteobacteria bacterium]|nr:molybdopterin molybdotransferase MoeA [Deltaproteobacteria bacterium]